MTDEARDDGTNGTGLDDEGPEEKMGLSFYAALAVLGILVIMILVLNYPAAKANAGIALAETNWTLRSLTDATGILIPAQSGTTVTAQFDGNGRMSGSAGCNGYFAEYQTRDYGMNITGIGSTKMFCAGPGIMDQESAYLADLAKVTSFRAGDSSLKCFDASGRTILEFGTA